MTFKERYNKLKEEHRCVGCGAKLPDEYTMIRCEHCLEYSRDSRPREQPREEGDYVGYRFHALTSPFSIISTISP